jgi:quercetin dioxygenase-like cupin family protein
MWWTTRLGCASSAARTLAKKGAQMKATSIVPAVALIAASGFALHATPAQQQLGITRTDLQRQDLTIPGYAVVQVRVDFEPGAAFGMHWHPGEEIAYVIEGQLEYQVEGKLPMTLKAGDVLFIPARTIHAARNVGTVNGAELATYVVEKGKPLVVMSNDR